VVTDAAVAPAALQRALKEAVAVSYNRVSVDGDMSTNDTLLVLANGASGVRITAANQERFQGALTEVCQNLARQIARDGEGASKSHTSKETVFMSRECKTGWEMDSQQGDQIVMRCVEQDDDANQ